MIVRIALAADTMLYLPIYAAKSVYRPPGITIEIETLNGDLEAYKRLAAGQVDMCVCDPMILADYENNFTQDGQPPSPGVLVAGLVQRVGFWGLTPVDTSATSPAPIRADGKRKFENVLCYKSGSTGGKLIDWLSRGAYIEAAKQEHCDLGQELLLLKNDLATRPFKHDLIFTCDLVGALVANAVLVGSNVRSQTIFGPADGPKSHLFTGLIAHRAFLKSNRKAALEVVESVNSVLADFKKGAAGTNKQLARLLVELSKESAPAALPFGEPDLPAILGSGVSAEADAGRLRQAKLCARALDASRRSRVNFFPAVRISPAAPADSFTCTEDELVAYVENALKKLHDDNVLPGTVRISKAGIGSALKMWGLAEHGDDKDFLKRYADGSVAKTAAPGPIRKWFLSVGSKGAPYILLAVLLVNVVDVVGHVLSMPHQLRPAFFWIVGGVFAVIVGVMLLFRLDRLNRG